VRFTKSFLAQMLGLRVSARYLEVDDPEYFAMKIRCILDSNVADLGLDLTFSEEIVVPVGPFSRHVLNFF
jgi:hypothetical protein